MQVIEELVAIQRDEGDEHFCRLANTPCMLHKLSLTTFLDLLIDLYIHY